MVVLDNSQRKLKMKIQFAQSSRQITPIKITQFQVIQDNRPKQVTTVEYETTNGVREMSFLNGVESILNERGRYIQAQSKKEFCATLVPDEVVEPVVASATPTA
jgi:hypothetical protein